MSETPLERVERALREAGCAVRGQSSTCPNHADSHPSLSFGPGSKGRDVVFHCHAGCAADDIMAALGLAWADLARLSPQAERDDVVARYVYTDEQGAPLFRVCRTAAKRFFQERWDAGMWRAGLKDTRRVLYRLPEVLDAVARRVPVWLCEGEKDADRLRAEGVRATCNPMGAGKLTADMAASLRGAECVVIVADNDPAGIAHAAAARQLVAALGAPVVVCRAAVGSDASDHLAAGLSLAQLVEFDPQAQPAPTAVENEAWDELLPLDSFGLGGLPEFPLDALPEWARRHAASQAYALQVPPDLPAMLALVGMSAACAGRVRVHVHSTWVEPCNLYAVVVLPSGAGKSPAVRAMLGAVDAYEHERADIERPRVERTAQRRRMLEHAMRKAEGKADTQEAQRLLDELLAEPAAALPRLIIDDATPEAIADMLAVHGGRLALVSTEGGPFEIMAGRYGDKANLDVYLKAWSGDSLRVDRIGRPSSVIREPLLTVGLTVQPDVLRVLGERPELARRGLVQRFMYAMPRSLVGSRGFGAPITAPDVRAAYEQEMLALLRSVEPCAYELEHAALDAFVGFQRQLEGERGEGGALEAVAVWTTKLESSIARTAGLLAAAERHTGAVTAAHMARALDIGRYWLAHALAVHGAWQHDPRLEDARAVAQSLVSRGVEEFSVRDMHRAQIRRFPTAEDLRAPLALLAERNYLRPLFDGPLVLRRGADSPRFAVHPALWTTHGGTAHVAHVAHVIGFDPKNGHVAHVAHVIASEAEKTGELSRMSRMSLDAKNTFFHSYENHTHADDDSDMRDMRDMSEDEGGELL